MPRVRIARRDFLVRAGAGLLAAPSFARPALSRAASRPVFTHGVQSGDVDAGSGVIWTRTDRPAWIEVEIATVESFTGARRLPPLLAGPDGDLAAKRLVEDLPPDQHVFFRLRAVGFDDVNAVSEPVVGCFRTAPVTRRSLRFAWGGDTGGQGFGIDDAGMTSFAAILNQRPDFFISAGDAIYADAPMSDELALPGGERWVNRHLTPEKRKVAETLQEFRGQWKYNLMDEHLRAMNAALPTFFQWDDHEVTNNWSPSKDLSADGRYTEKSVARLMARAGRAFTEMTPIRFEPAEPGRIFRKASHGPLLDIFFLDLRSYRSGNDAGGTHILGARQLAWLKRELRWSKAMWKVIAADMPLGAIVWDEAPAGPGTDGVADGRDGLPGGREREIADLLAFMRRENIGNTVWLTADVHYAAAHFYDPNRARFGDFEPFWEFVAGPLHAGTFGPSALDPTFGPQVTFIKAAPPGACLPPSAGLQFFGLVDIDGQTGQMTVRLVDRTQTELFAVTLDPAAAA